MATAVCQASTVAAARVAAPSRVSAFTATPLRLPARAQAVRRPVKVFAADAAAASDEKPTESAPSRDVWFPGNAVPEYLDGTLPGDYGFDPLGLGSDPELLRWNVQAELIHGRTAMTGVAGILIPSVATQAGVLNVPEWYDAGKVWVNEHPAFPFPSILFVQLLLCGWAESKRWADFKNPGSQADGSFFGITDDFKGQGNGYPGGRYFDFLGLSRGDPDRLAQYKVQEVKNGRLAMIAFLGFVCQYAATNKGPVQNLLDHIADPYHQTFATNQISLPFVNPLQ